MHVIADDGVVSFFDNVALLLGARVGVSILQTLLNFVACKSPPCDTRDRCHGVTPAPAKLVSQKTTDKTTDHGTGNAVLISYRSLMNDGNRIANLLRGFYQLMYGRNHLHFCITWPLGYFVTTNRPD